MKPSKIVHPALLLTLAFISACSGLDSENPVKPVLQNRVRTVHPAAKPVKSASQLCRQKIGQLKPVDGQKAAEAASFYASLPLLQIHSRVHPVLYLQIPRQDYSAEIKKIADLIPDNYRSRRHIRKLVKKYKDSPELLRRLFLKEGYLYETRFNIAAAIVKELYLDDLFNKQRIFIDRNGAIEPLNLTERGYVDSSGSPVKLVIGSRVAESAEELQVPLHLDIEFAALQTGARRIIPLTIFKTGALVKLIYPNDKEARVLIQNRGVKTTVVCQLNEGASVKTLKNEAEPFWRWIESLRTTALQMVLDRPDFDEPENEPDTEQEDGKLRIEWEKSYRQGKKVFTYRDLDYDVFNRAGQPVPPEVCIDFIFDTWERASGNWYKNKKNRPGKTEGYLDFDRIEHLNTRHTPSVLNYAKESNIPFERHDFKDRQQFKKQKKFAAAAVKDAEFIKEGDLLVIHGLREEDMKEHFHTLLVLETYPLTGIPKVVADNAGKPHIRTLASAMRSAPRRMLKYRLRLNWEWLIQQQDIFESGQ